MSPKTVQQSKELWGKAETFEELCELMACFIEGKIKFCPGWGGETVDSETKPLVPYLAAFNRAGLMTTTSQPGLYEEEGYKQRAFLDGETFKDIALRIAKLSLCTDLHISIFKYGVENSRTLTSSGYRIPVTIDDFKPYTFAGHYTYGYYVENLAFFSEVCHRKAMQELKQAWHVTIIDMTWGRNDLWDVLAQEFCYSP